MQWKPEIKEKKEPYWIFFIVIKELIHSILKCMMAVSNDYDI